jgi:hypothetical protein
MGLAGQAKLAAKFDRCVGTDALEALFRSSIELKHKSTPTGVVG